MKHFCFMGALVGAASNKHTHTAVCEMVVAATIFNLPGVPPIPRPPAFVLGQEPGVLLKDPGVLLKDPGVL